MSVTISLLYTTSQTLEFLKTDLFWDDMLMLFYIANDVSKVPNSSKMSANICQST